MKLLVWFLLLLSAKNHADGAKILGIFAFTAPSHYILGSALMKGLAEAGHDVTVVSLFKEKNVPKNGTYRQIVLTDVFEMAAEKEKGINFLDKESSNIFINSVNINRFVLWLTEETLKSEKVQKLLNSNEEFDVVIVEQFMNDAFKGFAVHFDAPLIAFSTLGANAWINHLVGNPSPLAYVPSMFLSYSNDMYFSEKLVNVAFSTFTYALHHLFVYPRHARLAKKYFRNVENFDDILFNSSIVLLNSHQSTNQPVPYVPNMIDIGGFHVNPPGKLPSDLQKFLDEAKDGVIYFSMGSNIKTALLPVEKREAFLKTFGQLKEKVLWKWEEDVLPGQPPNVKLGKWLPQQDILAHPNVKLFITHGGLLSTTETVYHGVPVLAIPIFADQNLNAQNIVNNGYGLSLSYSQITEEALTQKLTQLLTDPKFTRNVKRRSEIFHDRITGPMETAVYWVEYVARHRGAPHLRVAGVDLSLHQYLLLDVVAVALGIGLVFIYLVVQLVKKFKRKSQSKLKEE